jgi:hypothetical protein
VSRGGGGAGRDLGIYGVFPYFASSLRFDVSAARAGLEPVDIRVPRVDAYLDRLLEFAVRANWGRRPVGRAEAGAGVRALPEPAPA